MKFSKKRLKEIRRKRRETKAQYLDRKARHLVWKLAEARRIQHPPIGKITIRSRPLYNVREGILSRILRTISRFVRKITGKIPVSMKKRRIIDRPVKSITKNKIGIRPPVYHRKIPQGHAA